MIRAVWRTFLDGTRNHTHTATEATKIAVAAASAAGRATTAAPAPPGAAPARAPIDLHALADATERFPLVIGQDIIGNVYAAFPDTNLPGTFGTGGEYDRHIRRMVLPKVQDHELEHFGVLLHDLDAARLDRLPSCWRMWLRGRRELDDFPTKEEEAKEAAGRVSLAARVAKLDAADAKQALQERLGNHNRGAASDYGMSDFNAPLHHHVQNESGASGEDEQRGYSVETVKRLMGATGALPPASQSQESLQASMNKTDAHDSDSDEEFDDDRDWTPPTHSNTSNKSSPGFEAFDPTAFGQQLDDSVKRYRR